MMKIPDPKPDKEVAKAARSLRGAVIEDIDLNPFYTIPEDQMEFYSREEVKSSVAHEPVIHLRDGRDIAFVTEESEVGDYGTRIVVCGNKTKPYKQLRLTKNQADVLKDIIDLQLLQDEQMLEDAIDNESLASEGKEAIKYQMRVLRQVLEKVKNL